MASKEQGRGNNVVRGYGTPVSVLEFRWEAMYGLEKSCGVLGIICQAT